MTGHGGAPWSSERALWLEGSDAYGELLHAGALMVFAPPAGMLDRDATLASLRDAPRWTSARFSSQREVFPADDIALLAYRVRAGRGHGNDEYEAMCSSTWVRTEAGWRLALHQQTPIPRDDA